MAAHIDGGAGNEEQFVLRVLDEALAEKLRQLLREEIPLQGRIELTFSGAARLSGSKTGSRAAAASQLAGRRRWRGKRARWPPRRALARAWAEAPQPLLPLTLLPTENNLDGTILVEGTAYPVKLLNLPTVVEAYKTYDDVNLVKINDVGQARHSCTPKGCVTCCLSVSSSWPQGLL
jgi:hypothetical protein